MTTHTGQTSQDVAVPQPTTWYVVLHTWTSWVHLAYVLLIIGAYAFGGAFVSTNQKELITYVGLFIYVFLLLCLFVYFIISTSRRHAALYDQLYIPYARRARYAEAVGCLHLAVKRLNESTVYLGRCLEKKITYENDSFRESIRPALDLVAQAFGIVSGTRNRVCIKVLGGDPGNEHAMTFCRDTESHRQNRDRDIKEGNRHTVNGNTAFRLIIRGGRPHFSCNDLSKYPDYDNTSGPLDTLPYRACIVSRIGYTEPPDGAQEKPTLGLLAVDSLVTGIYDESRDVDLLGIVSGALFAVMSRWELVLLEKHSQKPVDQK